MEVVVGVHTREVKTALFLALNAIPSIEIAAIAASTAELVSYVSAFRPEAIIVEADLPGKPLADVLRDVDGSNPPRQILVIGGDDATEIAKGMDTAMVLNAIEDLTAVLAELDPEGGNQ